MSFLSRRRPPPLGGLPPYVWVGLGGTTVLIATAYYAFLDEVPMTKRKRWIATSPAWEERMGDGEYRRLLAANKARVLPADHRASVTVQRVGRRLAEASQAFCEEHEVKNYNHQKPYTYTVLRSDDTANAFVLPGNHVFVMTGLFRHLADEDELAAVLAHETAHNLARHAGERVSGNVLINVLARASLWFDPGGTFLTWMVPASRLLRELPHGRRQESEADALGVHLAAEACYDPRAAPRFFRKLAAREEQDGGGAVADFLSTHPSHERRLTDFDRHVPEAMKRFRARNDDGGDDRCASLRRSMREARRVAALRADAREGRTQRKQPQSEQQQERQQRESFP